MKKVVAIILAVLMLFVLCACGAKNDGNKDGRPTTYDGNKDGRPTTYDGKKDGGNKDGRPTTYDGKNEFEALLDYADRLEEAGNSEAAEAVYELIIKGGGAELIEKMHEDIPIIKAVDDLEQVKDAFGNAKGGDEE